MKYILIIWVCSFINNNGCMPPVESKIAYDSWYECSVAAHKESVSLLQKMGYANVNLGIIEVPALVPVSCVMVGGYFFHDAMTLTKTVGHNA